MKKAALKGHALVQNIAQEAVDLTNKEAWKRIRILLLENDVRGAETVRLAPEIWDERARLREARKAKHTLLKSEETPHPAVITTLNLETEL